MEDLLATLAAIDGFEMPDDDECILNNLEDTHPIKELINKAVGLADEVLVTEEGRCNWENHENLKKGGFHVFPGERDRFGWLTGCIQTKKGILVFG